MAIRYGQPTAYVPKHRAPYRHEGYPSNATCTCDRSVHMCPRHRCQAYTDMWARHATDSI